MIDWKELPDGKEKYQAYLCSPEWWAIRKRVIARADGVCENCGIGKVAHVHHLTYARKYNERLSDLLGVCIECHSGIHDGTVQIRSGQGSHVRESDVKIDMRETTLQDFVGESPFVVERIADPYTKTKTIIYYVKVVQSLRCRISGVQFNPLGTLPIPHGMALPASSKKLSDTVRAELLLSVNRRRSDISLDALQNEVISLWEVHLRKQTAQEEIDLCARHDARRLLQYEAAKREQLK